MNVDFYTNYLEMCSHGSRLARNFGLRPRCEYTTTAWRKSTFILLCLVLFFFSACNSKKDPQDKIEIRRNKAACEVNEYVKEIKKSQDDALENLLSQMTLAEKVSQLFILNLEGNKTFRPIDKLDGEPYVPGGYLFFSYNLADTPEEVRAFTDDIKNYCEERKIIPPFLAVDEEGGYVQRLRKLAGKLPAAEDVAKTYSIEEAYNLYFEHAQKVSAMGFHLNLAPVVEILSDYNREFLDGRSFGDAAKTNDYSIVALNAYQNNGIGCVIKHFPGNTNTDPHTGLPEIAMTYDDMMTSLEPFASVVEHSPAGVLMSHARTQILNDETSSLDRQSGGDKISSLGRQSGGEPSCFSSFWVSDVLRGEFGFDGIIFSDDIFMGALADNGYPPDIAAVKAVEAGIDCIMISEKRFLKHAQVLIEKAEKDVEFAKRIDEACRRVLKYKIKIGIMRIKN